MQSTIGKNTKLIKGQCISLTRIGIIGTGMLGKAVATRLLKSGYQVTVYNRAREKADQLKTLGAAVVDSPKDVTKSSDLVIIIVKDAQAVEDVSFGKNGIADGKHDGLVVADMSTINPVSSRDIAKKYTEKGIFILDMPSWAVQSKQKMASLLSWWVETKQFMKITKKSLIQLETRHFT